MANITAMTLHVLFNWDSCQPWARYMTVDSHGTIEVHEQEPRQEDGRWWSDGLSDFIGSIEPVMAERPIEPVEVGL